MSWWQSDSAASIYLIVLFTLGLTTLEKGRRVDVLLSGSSSPCSG